MIDVFILFESQYHKVPAIRNVQKRAREEGMALPRIFENERNKFLDVNGTEKGRIFPRFVDVAAGLYKQRIRSFGIDSLPKWQSDIALSGIWTQTHDLGRFLLLDKQLTGGRMLVFGSDRVLSRLPEFELLEGDGTFFSCPDMFSQVYSLHGILPSRTTDRTAVSIPILYAFLPNKEQSTYEQLFLCLREYMLENAIPVSTILKCKFDFEVAAKY